MRILLDTCTALWLMAEPEKVSSTAQKIFADSDNEVFLSVVSCWEISVKHVKGRLSLPESPATLVRRHREKYGTETLALEEEAALYMSRLPRLHSDPFDRMLICQSIVHGLAILTPDELIMQYAVRTLW
jgi:PIN domain nuclease of toxin-antitoxin system